MANCKGPSGSGRWTDFQLVFDRDPSVVIDMGQLVVETVTGSVMTGHRFERGDETLTNPKEPFAGNCRDAQLGAMDFRMTLNVIHLDLWLVGVRIGNSLQGVFVVLSPTRVVLGQGDTAVMDVGDTGTWGGTQTTLLSEVRLAP